MAKSPGGILRAVQVETPEIRPESTCSMRLTTRQGLLDGSVPGEEGEKGAPYYLLLVGPTL